MDSIKNIEEVESYQIGFKPVISDRVQKLYQNARDAYPSVCTERARYWTQSWKETECEPVIIRRAKALDHVLKNMTIYILDGELIVGNVANKPRASVIAPEFSARWLSSELNDPVKAPNIRPYDHHELSEESKKELIEKIIPFWQSKTVEDAVLAELPSETTKVAFPGISDCDTSPFGTELHLRHGVGHINVNYARVINEGIISIMNQVKEKLAAIRDHQKEEKEFYEAILITHEAFINWAKRYSRLALSLANKENDPSRKQELIEIAQICEHVPAYPARTFREAIQVVWFVHCIVFGLEQETTAVSPGRMDQYLYPYYKRDIEAGRITKEQAQELIELFFIKTSHMSILWDYQSARYFAGFSLTQDIMAGGVKSDGTDGTNELSYMFLEAEKQLCLFQPELAVRIHKNSPHEFLMKIAEVIRMGHGKPKVFVDNTTIPMLLSRGVSLDEARNYTIVGCVEPVSSGSMSSWPSASHFNLAKCLELALNSGVCMLTNKQIGPKTQKPETFKSIDEVLEAFRIQMEYFVKHMTDALTSCIRNHARLTPYPFISSLIDGCIEKGKELNKGGTKYNSIGVNAVAIPDTADSLAAIERIVFQEKKISMEELLEALRSNFNNHEDMRLMLQNKAPKYGNDDDFVDLFARKVGQMWCDEVTKHVGPYGIKFAPGAFTVSANVPFGLTTAALPSGRKATTPLANGGISATNGSDKLGPTAVIRSVCKIDHIKASNGTLLNLRFSPSTLKEERDIAKFADLLRSYAIMGGYHVQFNVISNSLLKKAQKEPQKYRNLLVRVAGYSTYFTELSKEVQDEIIARTIHSEIS